MYTGDDHYDDHDHDYGNDDDDDDALIWPLCQFLFILAEKKTKKMKCISLFSSIQKQFKVTL